MVLSPQVRQLCDLRGSSRPYINATREAYNEVIQLAPVHEIEIIVVLKRWRVENLIGNLGNLPLLCLRDYNFLLIETTYWLASEDVAGHPAVFLFYRVEVFCQGLLAAAQRAWDLIVETSAAE